MEVPWSCRMERSSVLSSRLSRGIQAGRGLVEAEQDGIGAHGAGDLEPALCAVGQLAGRVVGAVGEADLVQPVLGELDRPRFSPRAIAADAEHAEEGHARGEHQRVVLGDEQVLQHRHALEQADVLEGAGHLGLAVDPEVGEPFQQEGLRRPGG